MNCNLNYLLSKSKRYYNKKIFANFSSKKFLLENRDRLVVFGTGTVSKFVTKSLLSNNFKILVYADNNQKLYQRRYFQKKIISPKEIKKNFYSNPIIIASVIYEYEIFKQLKSMKIPHIYPLTYLNYLFPDIFDFRDYKKRYSSLFTNRVKIKILRLNNLWEDNESKKVFCHLINFRLKFYFNVNVNNIRSEDLQYFDKDIIKLTDKEIFVDGGAFDGDTLISFFKVTKGKFHKIYSFEPDKKNFDKLKETVRKISSKKRIIIINKGLSNYNGQVIFYSLGTSTSGIGDNNGFYSLHGKINKNNQRVIRIPVVRLDKFFTKRMRPPTFIKLDIEGAEIKALQGAKKIIKGYKPKLAISVYHNPSDLWEIPLLIKKLNKNYKLYLRHYSQEIPETICYAV